MTPIGLRLSEGAAPSNIRRGADTGGGTRGTAGFDFFASSSSPLAQAARSVAPCWAGSLAAAWSASCSGSSSFTGGSGCFGAGSAAFSLASGTGVAKSGVENWRIPWLTGGIDGAGAAGSGN